MGPGCFVCTDTLCKCGGGGGVNRLRPRQVVELEHADDAREDVD